MNQKVNIGQSSTTMLEFLKSSIFMPVTLNLKRICISAYWIQPPFIFEVNIGQRSTKAEFLKLSICIWLTWNFQRSCPFGHWIQPQIIFEVKSVLWILQVSCSARHLVIYKMEDFSSILFCGFCYSVCLFVACRSQF